MSRMMQQVETDGQRIWVEVDDILVASTGAPALSGGKFSNTATNAGNAEDIAQTITRVDLSATLGAVIGPAKAALERFKPDEVNLELTLGFKAEIGVFVASGEANAQVKVSAKWKPSVSDE